MSNDVSASQAKRIKKAVYEKADAFGYMTASRIESGEFMDQLVEDPEIGGVLKEYMSKERIRTYIKDGILNAYTKAKNNQALASVNPRQTVKSLFNYDTFIIYSGKGKEKGVFVLRALEGCIFVVSSGTTLKWETALRKALDLIAQKPTLIIDGKKPFICLQLSELSQGLTDADRVHIQTALGCIGVKAIFCR